MAIPDEPLTLAKLMPAGRRRFPWKVATVAAVVIVLAAVGALAFADRPGTIAARGIPLAASTTYAPTSAAPTKIYVAPTPEDFTLTVNELSRKCFGSAGCNVTFSIKLTNVGAHEFDPAKNYKLVYTINGAEDPYTNNLTISGDSYSYEEEEFTQVKNSSTKLTATITAIIPA